MNLGSRHPWRARLPGVAVVYDGAHLRGWAAPVCLLHRCTGSSQASGCSVVAIADPLCGRAKESVSGGFDDDRPTARGCDRECPAVRGQLNLEVADCCAADRVQFR